MTLLADRILDRRRLKRRLGLWQAVAISALILAVVVVAGRMNGIADVADGDYVARLDVNGVIFSDPERDQALAELADSERALALILRIDSPGGTVVGGESLYRSVRRVAAKKPVVAVMRETATSAAYMVAIAADHLLAHEGSVTGSIGVLMQTADMTELMAKIGIRPETVKSGPLKAQPNPMEPFTPPAREAIQSVVLDLHGMFVSMVSKRRDMDLEQARKLADGRVYTGRQAKANGLVDALGGEYEALDWLIEKRGIPADTPVKSVKINRDDPLWRRALQEMSGKVLLSERLRPDGLLSIWRPGL